MEKLFNTSYTNFAPHPDGSNRIFLGAQSDKIYLATVPPQGSGKPLDVDLTSPFIDLTDVVHYDNEFGLMGFTFHLNFSTNGIFLCHTIVTRASQLPVMADVPVTQRLTVTLQNSGQIMVHFPASIKRSLLSIESMAPQLPQNTVFPCHLDGDMHMRTPYNNSEHFRS